MARYSDFASSDEVVLVETDDFALVYDRQNRAFRKKRWDSSTKSWTTGWRAPYSAIVCKDDSTVWAEDSSGKTIASGEAGVDDASVIQRTIDKVYNEGWGGKVVLKGTFDIYPATKYITIRNMNSIHLYGGKLIIHDYPDSWVYGIFVENSSNIVIEKLSMDANEVTGESGLGAGIVIRGSTNVIVKYCELLNFRQFAMVIGSDAGQTTTNINILYNYITSKNIRDAIGSLSRGVEFSNVKIIGNTIIKSGKPGAAMTIIGCPNLLIANNYCKGSIILGGEEGINEQFTISNNIVRRTVDGTSTEIGVISSSNGARDGIIIDNQVDGQIYVWGYDDNTRASDIWIVGNKTYGYEVYGIYSKYSDRIYIMLNEMKGTQYDLILNNVKNSYVFFNKFTTVSLGYGTTNITFKHNIGYTTENSGAAAFSGDGTTTDFEIGAHGLVITDPSKIAVKVTPVSQDAIDASPCVGYVDPADNTKIRVKFSSAPASGSENVKIVWYAEVIS